MPEKYLLTGTCDTTPTKKVLIKCRPNFWQVFFLIQQSMELFLKSHMRNPRSPIRCDYNTAYPQNVYCR